MMVFRAFLPESATTRRFGGVCAIDAVAQIAPGERAKLKEVTDRYPFHANKYYLDLVDWDDQTDPIRQLIIPQTGELTDWGDLDPSNEGAVTVAPGVQHKYDDTALLLCSRVCGASCRYCFCKRLFMDENDGVADDLSEGLAYIERHAGVSDVLLTGGDPLAMSTQRLVGILQALRDIPHVEIIRIGSPRCPRSLPGGYRMIPGCKRPSESCRRVASGSI
ncbi:MAG: hypothetical protein ACE5HE_08540 [Phycisphaerae bacterium]